MLRLHVCRDPSPLAHPACWDVLRMPIKTLCKPDCSDMSHTCAQRCHLPDPPTSRSILTFTTSSLRGSHSTPLP